MRARIKLWTGIFPIVVKATTCPLACTPASVRDEP